MSTIRIRPEHRAAIARAILDDEASQNGEHLYDGERLVFYCPMQAADPPGHLPRVSVRGLLPADLRIPTFGDYLASSCPGVAVASLTAEERGQLLGAYEAAAVARLAAALPAESRIMGTATPVRRY